MWQALLLAACWLPWWSSGSDSLYERLGVPPGASLKQLRKAWHAKALAHHPDKAEGPAEVEKATRAFAKLAEAYEVLSDAKLRAEYDRTGSVPSDKQKAEASARKARDDTSEDFGFEGGSSDHHRGFRRERFSEFEIRMAQQRVRRVRSLAEIRRQLQDGSGVPMRHGLVGFYRRGEEAMLKEALRFPYPFAGWSLAAEGRGFWWEDTLQTFLVVLSASTETSEISSHFGLTHSSELPALAWVNKDEALSFEITRPQPSPFGYSNEPFISWVHSKLGCSIRIVNLDHRPVKIWWIDGYRAREMALLQPGAAFDHGSFVSHRWYAWASGTQGTLLSEGASLGSFTLDKIGEKHEFEIQPRCVDENGHCEQWKHKGECERNSAFMMTACARSCGRCEEWGWLYELRLGALHKVLECWTLRSPPSKAQGICASLDRTQWPPAHKVRSRNELRRLPLRVKQWLRALAQSHSAEKELLEAFAYDAPPPAAFAMRGRAPAPPPAPPPQQPTKRPNLPPPSRRVKDRHSMYNAPAMPRLQDSRAGAAGAPGILREEL